MIDEQSWAVSRYIIMEKKHYDIQLSLLSDCRTTVNGFRKHNQQHATTKNFCFRYSSVSKLFHNQYDFLLVHLRMVSYYITSNKPLRLSAFITDCLTIVSGFLLRNHQQTVTTFCLSAFITDCLTIVSGFLLRNHQQNVTTFCLSAFITEWFWYNCERFHIT